MDLDEHNPSGGKYVGAKMQAEQLKASQTRRVGNLVETIVEAKHDRTWVFSSEPQETPNTGYYRDRAGRLPYELICADTATAKLVGVVFVDPQTVIAEAKGQRRAEYDAQHGDGAFDSLQPEPVTVEQKAPVAKKTTAAPAAAK